MTQTHTRIYKCPLGKELANFFCRDPGSKYFGLRRPRDLCRHNSTLSHGAKAATNVSINGLGYVPKNVLLTKAGGRQELACGHSLRTPLLEDCATPFEFPFLYGEKKAEKWAGCSGWH